MNLSDTIHPVAIFGVPRSGTSWLGQIMNSSPNVAYRYQPLFSYAFKDYLDEQSSAEDIQHFHEELLTTEDEFVTQKYNIIHGKRLVRTEKNKNITSRDETTKL